MPSVADRMLDYRQAVGAYFENDPSEDMARPGLRLPDRGVRRLAVGDQRIGPIDFLAIIGCPLSEIVAARNGPLGKVLVPTRRLAHETRVASAIEECLPSLEGDRAERLQQRLDEKRTDLPAHVWNAVWLDADLERFLSTRPAALFGGGDPNDGPRQLSRAARAVETLDVEALEAALHALRDNAPLGPLWVDLLAATRDLDRVAEWVGSLPPGNCDIRTRRLIRVFHEKYVPLQPALGELDRSGRDILEGLDALYRASAIGVLVPDEMQRFVRVLLGDASSAGAWSGYRAAVLAHATSWQHVLEACGVTPGSQASRA